MGGSNKVGGVLNASSTCDSQTVASPDHSGDLSAQKSQLQVNTSIFSMFSPCQGPDSDGSPHGVTQIAPKLNAQTLFAFGAD